VIDFKKEMMMMVMMMMVMVMMMMMMMVMIANSLIVNDVNSVHILISEYSIYVVDSRIS